MNREILHQKFLSSPLSLIASKPIITAEYSEPLAEVVAKMVKHSIGALPVTDDKHGLIGIFTERDLLKVCRQYGAFPDSLEVSQVMTKELVWLRDTSQMSRLIYEFAIGGFRHIPVKLKDSSLGMISVRDLLSFLHRKFTARLTDKEPEIFLKSVEVDEYFLGEIGRIGIPGPQRVTKSATVMDAILMMLQNRVGSLLVRENKGHLIDGIFTERDLVKRVIAHSIPLDTAIDNVMTPKPTTVLESASLALVINLLVEGGFRQLPIMDHSEEPIGIISVEMIINYISRSILLDRRS